MRLLGLLGTFNLITLLPKATFDQVQGLLCVSTLQGELSWRFISYSNYVTGNMKHPLMTAQCYMHLQLGTSK